MRTVNSVLCVSVRDLLCRLIDLIIFSITFIVTTSTFSGKKRDIFAHKRERREISFV